MNAMTDRFLDTASIAVDDAEVANAQTREAEAVKAAAEEADAQRKVWLSARVDALTRKHGVPAYMANQIVTRAVDQMELTSEFELHVIDPSTHKPNVVTVKDVLGDPNTYHNCTTLDPFEPEYSNSKVVGILYLKTNAPKLVSQALGGATYSLSRSVGDVSAERTKIELEPDNTAAFVDRCIDVLVATDRYYSSGSTTVCRDGELFKPVRTERLDYDLSRLVAPFQVSTSKAGPISKSVEIPRRLLLQAEALCDGKLPKLAGTSDHPLCRVDGSLMRDMTIRRASLFSTAQGHSPKLHSHLT